MISVVPKQIIAYYAGWLSGSREDIPAMRVFGFSGDMIPAQHRGHERGVIEYVSATPEIMEKAFKEWPDFNYRSFTAIDQDGKQLPYSQQPYYRRER